MRFEWDDEKNESNISKHGFDFADAWEIFEAPLLTALDDGGTMVRHVGLESAYSERISSLSCLLSPARRQ